MSKTLAVTHLVYILIFLSLAFFFRQEILQAYLQSRLSKAGDIELVKDILIYNQDGKEVGKLYQGVKLMSPALEDLNDTDLSDNRRYKLLLDLKTLDFKKENDRKFSVYQIGNGSETNL